MGGATPPLQKQMKMKKEPSETTSADEALMTKSTPWHIVQREEKKKSVRKTGPTTISQGCTRVHHVQQRLDKMHLICSRAKETWPTIFDASNRDRSTTLRSLQQTGAAQWNRWGSMGRIQGPHNIHGRGNRKGEEGRIRPTTGGKRGTTKLPRKQSRAWQCLIKMTRLVQWRDVNGRLLKG